MEARIIVHPGCIAWYVEQSSDFTYQAILFRYLLNEEEIALIKEKLYGLYGSLTPESFTDKADEYFKSYCNQIRKLKIKKVRSREGVLSLIYSVIEDVNFNEKPKVRLRFPNYANRIVIRFRI